jgi:hypothetical protein
MKNFIYKLLSISNDAKAVSKNKVGQRIVTKAAHKATGKAMRKLFK